MEKAGREVGGQPSPGKEAAGKDDRWTASPEPGRAALDLGRWQEPPEGSSAEPGSPQETSCPEQHQVAQQDAGETGHDSGQEAEPPLSHEQPGRDARQVLAHQGRGGDQPHEDHESQPGGRRHTAGVERRHGPGRAGGIRVGSSGGQALLDTRDKIEHRSGQLIGVAKQQEVIRVQHHQLTLRYQAMVLTGGGTRHQNVAFAVQNQGRALEALEGTPQGSLIAVVEVAGAGDV